MAYNTQAHFEVVFGLVSAFVDEMYDGDKMRESKHLDPARFARGAMSRLFSNPMLDYVKQYIADLESGRQEEESMVEIINKHYALQVRLGDAWLSMTQQYRTLAEARSDLDDKNQRVPATRRIVAYVATVVYPENARNDDGVSWSTASHCSLCGSAYEDYTEAARCYLVCKKHDDRKKASSEEDTEGDTREACIIGGTTAEA